MDIFMMLWFWILPIYGLLSLFFVPIVWFFVVPQLARKLTFMRFRHTAIHAIADDSGYVELVAERERLPEGVVLTERGWRFLPRPVYSTVGAKGGTAPNAPAASEASAKEAKEEQDIESVALKPYILKGMGKIIWFGYAGKITSMNPAVLAALQQTTRPLNVQPYFEAVDGVVKDVPKHFQKALRSPLASLRTAVQSEPLTPLNLNRIKSVIQKLYPPSVWRAYGINRELRGAQKKGRELFPLILGGAIIIGLVVLGIVAMLTLGS